MQSVRDILAAHGFDDPLDMSYDDRVKVEVGSEAMMPLSIEKVGEDRISVAHYYTQRGDLMSDPEIVYRVDGDQWTPVRYTQHPHLHQHDESGLPDVAAFSKTWDRNLRNQGYVEAAQQGGER